MNVGLDELVIQWSKKAILKLRYSIGNNLFSELNFAALFLDWQRMQAQFVKQRSDFVIKLHALYMIQLHETDVTLKHVQLT